MRHLGFTGTRQGLSLPQSQTLREILGRLYLSPASLHFGDCIGADKEAAAIAISEGYSLHSHPSDIDEVRAFVPADIIEASLPPLIRNRVIVDASLVLVACPSGKVEQLRSGTWATVRYARKMNRWIVLVYPDGSSVLEYAGVSRDIRDLQIT